MKNRLYGSTPDGIIIPSFRLEDGALYATLEDINPQSTETIQNRFVSYLQTVARPHKKLVKLEFLQPDNSVAFSLDNRETKNSYRGSPAFLEDGPRSV
ncbi:MAG: hypothetical protein KBS59_05805, partial [Clostridiales bacterium]|nr:hypothetical protein [Clostridiales bacterium]